MTCRFRVLIRSLVLACAVALLPAATASADAKWEQVKSASGTIKSTTAKVSGNNNNRSNNGNKNGANNSNYRVKPVYVEFETTHSSFRVKYDTKETGDRPDLRIELEKEITKPNGNKDWQRVGLVGRARGDDSGGNAFASEAGRYRFELTGQHTQYKIVVDQSAGK